MLLHCRPVKYNYTMPFENPNYCYPLGPFIVVMASVGLAMDALTWLLSHYVVWRLQLPLVHRLAITAIFAFGLITIIIGALRIRALSRIQYQGSDVTWNIGTCLMWAIAQMSAGIIVACCPHLRPIFEKVLPHRLTRVKTKRPEQACTARQRPILVTTSIALEPSHQLALVPAVFHDGQLEPWAPTFDVERGPAAEMRVALPSCKVPSRGCGCC